MGRSIWISFHCTAHCCTSACRGDLGMLRTVSADTPEESEIAEAGPLPVMPAAGNGSCPLDPGWPRRLAMTEVI